MKNKITILLILLLFVFNGVVFPEGSASLIDSTNNSHGYPHHKRHPVIEMRVSNARFNLENLPAPVEFNYSGTIQINLGYRTFEKKHPAGKYFEKYISLAYSSNKFVNNSEAGFLPIDTEVWRLAAVNEVGYHHRLGVIGITPYYSSGYFLYNFDYSISTVCPAVYDGACISGNEKLDRFTGTVHFGKNFEQGIKIGLGEKLSLDAGYTEQLFLPRFMTWKFFGSEILYGFSRVALDKFTRSIIQDSPALGSVIDVALVSGLNYLVYYFQKQNMNWPFRTEAPITSEGIKVGFSLIF